MGLGGAAHGGKRPRSPSTSESRFKKKYIYLLIYLSLAMLGLSCGVRDILLWRELFVVVCGLSSCSLQAL